MSASLELLEELSVPREPSRRALEAFLARFEARAPHEVAPGYPRAPGQVVEELLGEGLGTIGAERTATVRHLARLLGHSPRLLGGTRSGRGGAAVPHAALLFELPEGPALCDPAFPLLGLVPVGGGPVGTPWGRLDCRRGAEGLVVEGDGRGRRLGLLTLAEAGEEALAAVPAPEPGALIRLHEDRVACWSDGRLTILDAWSRYAQPLADPLAIEHLFGVAPEAPPARAGDAVLSVYDRCQLPADMLLARIGTPAGFLALTTPGLSIAALTPGGSGWSWTLQGEDGTSRDEAVTRVPGGLLVEPVAATGPIGLRRYTVESTPDGARLVLETRLLTVPPRALAEPVRKTLVFHLASELLAWGRIR